MKELFELIFHFKLKKLFFEPTKNSMIQFFRYAFVGGIATVVDWAVQYVITTLGAHYLVAAVFAFLAGLGTNFALSKLFVFNGEKGRVSGVWEFVSYGVIGVAGLGFTMVIMYLLTSSSPQHRSCSECCEASKPLWSALSVPARLCLSTSS